MLNISSAFTGLVIMTVGSALCLIRGDSRLRTAAAALMIDSYACELLEDWNGAHKIQPVIFGIDVAYSALLLFLVTRSSTRWPQFAAVAQTLIVATHLGAMIGPQVTRWDFFSLYYALSYAVLAALLYGALAEAPGRSLVARKKT